MPNETATATVKDNSKKMQGTDHASEHSATIGSLPETDRQLAVDNSNTNITDGDTNLSASSERETLWREAGFESWEQYQMHYGFAKLLDEMLRSQDVKHPRAVSVDPDLAKGRTCLTDNASTGHRLEKYLALLARPPRCS